KEFVGAVQPGHLPFKHLHREDNILFFQPLPKLFRQIGHLVKAVRKLHMQPFIDLSGAERLLSHFLHFSFHLIISKCADILFHCVSFPCLCCSSSCGARFTSLAMKNPSHLCTPGRSWRHPFSWTLSLSSRHRRSLMPSCSNPGYSSRNQCTLSIFSAGFTVQVLYRSTPPGFTYLCTQLKICRCSFTSASVPSGDALYLRSAFFPRTPSPEQGRSAITRSAFSSNSSSNTAASHTSASIFSSSACSMFSRIRSTFFSVRSLACTCPVPSIRSAAWSAFPPGAAHTS